MEWLLNTVLSMILATDVRSPDPAIAAMKRAALLMVVCALGEVAFLVLAYAAQPDAEAAPVLATIHGLAARIYGWGALSCMMGLTWSSWLWWRAYRAYCRPDLHHNM